MKKNFFFLVFGIALATSCTNKPVPTTIVTPDTNDIQVTEAYSALNESLSNEIDKLQIQVKQLAGALTISVAETVFFDSGSAELKTNSLDVLNRIGEILLTMSNKNIRVEGHTDNKKISKKLQSKYPSNWELSADRAVNVVRYFQDKVGIDPGNLSAVGYSEFRPVASNDTPEGRAQNRRIEIVVTDKLEYTKVPVIQTNETKSTNESILSNPEAKTL